MEQADVTSLIPILITLFLALTTRNVVVGLFAGVVSGVAMLEGTFVEKGPLESFSSLMKSYLLPQLTDSYNAGVILLLVFIGGFVALMEKSGGGVAFAKKVTQWVASKCQAQLSAWFGGAVIFFSDLGTPLIVGPVFRPLFDKLKVSRQKLAFIIDSTSSPVAILIPFIGWGVYIMGLIQKEFTALNVSMSDWDAFIGAIPYQFYAFLAIAIVPIVSFFKLDFGPMAKAEQLAEQVPTLEKFRNRWMCLRIKMQNPVLSGRLCSLCWWFYAASSYHTVFLFKKWRAQRLERRCLLRISSRPSL